MKRRVVVTGMGVVTGLGLGLENFWAGMVEKKSAVRPIPWDGWGDAPVQVAAMLQEKLPGDGWRNLRMADWALQEALGQGRPGGRGGIAAAIGWPGPDEEGGEEDPIAYLADKNGINGIRMESLAACAASTQMIGEAFWRIRNGEVDWMVAGGADGRVHPGGILGYDRLGALTRGFRERPTQACRPFGADRSGFVVGEGAGFLILENEESAEKRGARILAEIRGAAAGCDAWRVTDPGEGGQEAEACLRGCLVDAGMEVGEVDAVVAHGTGTLANDRAEAEVLRRIFGVHEPKVVTPKASIGHLSMACGAVESVLAVKCLQVGVLSGPGPTDWKTDPYCCHVGKNWTPVRPPRNILKPSFGFGGQNACLVFSTWRNEPAAFAIGKTCNGS